MTITTLDPHIHPVAHARLSRQSQTILDAFRAAPGHRLTSQELIAIAHRFGARLHDIRGAGYQIDLIENDHKTGRTVYELRGVACAP